MRTITSNFATRSLASDLFEEMDRFWVDWNRVIPAAKVYDERDFDPACEVSESDEHYFMSVDLPGMKKEEIKIEVTDKTLTISGQRKRQSSDKSQKVQCYEKSYGFFKRSFALPATIESDKVEARYEDGVLELYLPKTQIARPRHIEIQSSHEGFFGRFLGSKKIHQESNSKNVETTKVS